jgi:hypothetical protein
LHNGLALSTGYFAAKFAGLPERDRRAVSIEVGIQNFGPGPDPDFQLLRRPRRHGHRHGVVGHLAHRVGPHRVDLLDPAASRMSQVCVLVTGSAGYLGSQVVGRTGRA